MPAPLTLTPQQQAAFDRLLRFLDSSDHAFVLRGYAGTGKTTLLRQLLAELSRRHRSCELLAPTGRAARVLADVTRHPAQTIHSRIYDEMRLKKDEADGKDKDKEKNYFGFYFPLAMPRGPLPSVVVVDEASMLSDEETHSEFLTFGSGRLLADLLTFYSVPGATKLVFVGDEAQLPPVGSPTSPALDADHLRRCGLRVSGAQLVDVVRQRADSGIVKLATTLRQQLELPRQLRRLERIPANCADVHHIKTTDVASIFCQLFPHPSTDGVIICHANQRAIELNAACRQHYFPHSPQQPCADDVLMVVQNNRSTQAGQLYNGDLLVVEEAEAAVTTHAVTVVRGKTSRRIELSFRQCRLHRVGETQAFQAVLLDNQLFAQEPHLGAWLTQALRIDFEQRVRVKLKGKIMDEAMLRRRYLESLASDPFVNALRVKFGYAVTCHKAQGGEWDTAFVDYSGRTSWHDDALRWRYTAVTRARRQLYVAGAALPRPILVL